MKDHERETLRNRSRTEAWSLFGKQPHAIASPATPTMIGWNVRALGDPLAIAQSFPADVIADLRTDHAGETGAVCIYRGVLVFARDPAIRAFAQRHLATEQAHLRQIEAWLPKSERSHVLPIWHVAGWLTGALPALFGPRMVYATIEAVEQFVDQHYEEQIRRLATYPALYVLRQTLIDCQGDEIDHRNEAAALQGPCAQGLFLRAWCRLVDIGSRCAVRVCRVI